MAFTQLGKLLPRRLRQAGIERDVQASRIVSVANDVLVDVFGENVASDHTRAMVFKHQQIKIATTNASARQELMIRQLEIIKKINDTIGEDRVKRIQIMMP